MWSASYVFRRAVLAVGYLVGEPVAAILPFTYRDEVTGDTISVYVSPYYSKITVNRREYYFLSESGEFDGAASIVETGPLLIYDGE